MKRTTHQRSAGLLTGVLMVLTAVTVFGTDGRLGISQSMIPYTIINPGSYYLTENLTATDTNDNVITIFANDVTIDLNGFTIEGTGLRGPGCGIVQNDVNINLTVRNGTICEFPYSYGLCASGQAVRVENVTASGNTIGIFVEYGGLVSHCTAVSNRTGFFPGGIRIRECGSVRNCNTAYNGSRGSIRIDQCGVIRDCTAFNGHHGIIAKKGSVIARCNATSNFMHGIIIGNGVAVDSAAQHNRYNGICISNVAAVVNCNGYANGRAGIGPYFDEWGGYPAGLVFGSVINDCSASENAYGIFCPRHSLVSGCTTRANTNDGIRAWYDGAYFRDNLCSDHTSLTNGAGIRVAVAWGSRSWNVRIDGNTLSANYLGLDLQESHNFVIRNYATGNVTNYSMVETQNMEVITYNPMNNWPWANYGL